MAPVGTVLKCSLGKRNLGGYASTVDNVLRGGCAGDVVTDYRNPLLGCKNDADSSCCECGKTFQTTYHVQALNGLIADGDGCPEEVPGCYGGMCENCAWEKLNKQESEVILKVESELVVEADRIEREAVSVNEQET